MENTTALETTAAYRRLFLDDLPMLDVRAPIEFEEGAFPMATNIPLMNNEERHAVGIQYKEAGQQAAIELGHALVSGQARQERTAHWVDFVRRNPNAVLYCFRGGLRSQIAQQWLTEAGVSIARVAGGYKAMRSFLLSNLQTEVTARDFVVVGGLTGSGKTDVIRALAHSLDLEGIAQHRGSSFGGRVQSQPSQIDFENKLSIQLLKLAELNVRNIAIEDEAHLIGRCAVPLVLRQKTSESDFIWVTAALEDRVNRIIRDYIESLHSDYVLSAGDLGNEQFEQHLTRSLFNLRKRLGLQRHAELTEQLRQALAHQWSTGSFELHRAWIEPMLIDYYDPMYEYQRQQRKRSPIFEGNVTEVIEFLQTRSHS
jgi:tRNA 2-selenouridine synthase